MFEGVKVALDPTARQERLLMSHAGAARFAFNAGLAHVKEQLEDRAVAKAAGVSETELPSVDWNLYALRRWWNAHKAMLAPWWAENSKEAYSSGLDGLARALKSWSDSRCGKRKGEACRIPAIQVTGARPSGMGLYDRFWCCRASRCEASAGRPGAHS